MSWLDTEITADHLALDNVESEGATNALLAQGIGLFSNDVQIARAGRIQNVRGNELAKTPSFTGNVALNWTDDLSWGELKGTIQYTYRGGFKHRIFNNNTTDVVPNYDVLDVMLGFYPAGAQNNLRFELIGKNLFDKDGINARFTDVFGVGATGDELIAPRQIMLRIGAEF
jgi:TonB dependent receptor.